MQMSVIMCSWWVGESGETGIARSQPGCRSPPVISDIKRESGVCRTSPFSPSSNPHFLWLLIEPVWPLSAWPADERPTHQEKRRSSWSSLVVMLPALTFTGRLYGRQHSVEERLTSQGQRRSGMHLQGKHCHHNANRLLEQQPIHATQRGRRSW